MPNIEKIVLASLMESKDIFDNLISKGLSEKYFLGINRKIFLAICEAREQYQDDQITVVMLRKWKDIPLSELVKVSDSISEVPSIKGEYIHYFDILQEEYYEREVKEYIKETKKWTEESLTELNEKILSLTENRQETTEINQVIDGLINEIEIRHKGGFVNKYRTKLRRYDKLGHFEEGSLVIIAGKSGHGKSTFAINLANRWLENGLRVVYITYEMTRMAVLGKLSIARTEVEWDKVFKTKDIEITDEEYKYIIDGIKWYKDKPIIIMEGADTPAKVEYYVRKYKADVFVIDTVNFLTSESSQFWIKLGNLASAYKRIAVKYNTLGVMLAQGSSFTGRPTRKELLAESKKMKDSADYIDFVYREQEENPTSFTPQLENIIEIYRVKGRFTGTGYCYLYFSGKISKVKDLSDWEYEVVKEVLHGK